MDRIGRYRIVGELGQGGMGIVYRAIDPVLERQVAIKTILGRVVSPEQGERFLREVRATGRLSHRNIVMSLDAGQDGGRVYVVMELIEGNDLSKILRSGPVPCQKVLQILSAVGEALDYAHSKGIVHRDIKPANIMVGDDGSVKLTDLGVAKLLDRESITPRGDVIGTPQYTAPELWMGSQETGLCDQFSLAVVAYEALVGRLPFQGKNIHAVIHSITKDEPLDCEQLSQSTNGLLRKALSKEPSNRFKNCAAFPSALADSLAGPQSLTSLPTDLKPTAPISAEPLQTPMYLYANEGCVYLQHSPDNSDSQARLRNSQQIFFGQRFNLIKRDGAFFHVSTSLGAEGWILNKSVTETDPRLWFSGEWDGRKLIGYWRTGRCNSFPLDPACLRVEGQRVDVPMNRVMTVQYGPLAITFTTYGGTTITSDSEIWNDVYNSPP